MGKSADAFRTISEVADWLGVQTHVLRFWESKFTQVKPVKRAGGRRYYRPADMLLLGGIRKLLHDDGLTIKGVQKILREDGMAYVADMSPPLDDDTTAKLDSDLVAKVDDDVTPDTPADDAPASIDQSPIITLHQHPIATSEDAAPDIAPEPTEMPPITDDPAPAEPAVADSQHDPADIPTLTPDFVPEPESAELEVTSDEPSETKDEVADVSPSPDAELQPDLWSAAAEPEGADPEVSEHDAPEPVETAEVEAAQAAAPEPEPEPEPEQTPRARIVDAPDDVADADTEITPSALTKASRLDRLTPAQRDAMRPLIAQLTALRDQMSDARQNRR
jgi:DNA-binding transcriptional MerR regulator